MNSTLRLYWPALALAVLSPLVAQEAGEQKAPVLSPSKELELYNLREIAKLRTLSSNTDIASGSLSLEGGRHELPDTYRDTVVRDTNAYGSLYNVTSNWPGYNLVIERRATNRVSGVRTFPGDAVERHFNPVTPYWPGPARTNPPTVHAWGTQYHPTALGEVKPLPPPAPVTNVAQVLFTFKAEGYELKLIKVPTQQPATPTASNGFSRLTFGPHWLIPRMAEVALQWEPSADAVPAYRVYARSSKTTNEWVSKPEWLFTPGYTGEAVNFSVVLDLSVPTWTQVVAIDNYSKEESPATAPVLHSALTPIKPPGQHKVMYVRPLNEPIEHRSRATPLPLPPVP